MPKIIENKSIEPDYNDQVLLPNGLVGAIRDMSKGEFDLDSWDYVSIYIGALCVCCPDVKRLSWDEKENMWVLNN